MKKIIMLSLLVAGAAFASISNVNAAGYEPTYPASCCDYQGWDSCVNYDCVTPRPKPKN